MLSSSSSVVKVKTEFGLGNEFKYKWMDEYSSINFDGSVTYLNNAKNGADVDE